MGRQKVSDQVTMNDRIRENRGESLKVKDKKLWCDLCAKFLLSLKKDSVKKHVQSDGHNSKKGELFICRF